ncbi:MAG: cobalamin-dependent protein [Nanoarchaeota archaeon]|nr:cobalamin-dependent protein [Nanoarchaeota archaeon]
MKNVLLIGPHNPNIRTGQYLAPPLGIHRIASYLKSKGVANVDVVDPNLRKEGLYERLKSCNYDIIGSSLLHPTLEHDLRIIFDVEDIQPNALKIIGGQGASFNYEEILKKTPAGIVVRGYGEKTLENILGHEGELRDIPGIHLKQNGKIYSTPLLKKMSVEEFKEISLCLSFENIPYNNYWKYMAEQYGGEHLKAMKNEGMVKTIRLMTSNYCPMGCTFCSSTNFLDEASEEKQKLLQLTSKEIISLIKKAIRAYPETTAFYFNDDNFMLDKKRNEEFYKSMQTFDGKYNLMCMGRVDNVDYDTLKKMKKAGFKIVFYGVETFSSSLAKDIKKTRRDDYEKVSRKAILDTLRVGLVSQSSLMLFLPSSTEKDLNITIENSVDLMEQGARITIFPYIEAYSGAEITKNHRLSYNEFTIKDKHFKFPYLVLPDDPNIEELARKSINLKERLNDKFRSRFGSRIAQPIDSLNLFKAIYTQLGKSTKKIEKVIKRLA